MNPNQVNSTSPCRRLPILYRQPIPVGTKATSQKVLYSMLFAVILCSACKKDVVSNLAADDSIIETLPAIQTAVTTNVNSDCAGYYQAVPALYDSSRKKYPLILFIHGIGELGNGASDLPNMLRTGLPRLIAKKQFPASFELEGQHYSFIVISPQFKKWPSNAEVHSVLEYALKRYRVDTSRIYITGLSMGGGVTWNYIAEYGRSVAAAIPICGGSWPDDTRARNIASFNLPVWAFHNSDDATVPVAYSLDYVKKINSYHPAVTAKVTTWPTGGHDSWTKTYDPAYKENGLNIYQWMLKYTRSGMLK